jgi:hypothetical protein
MAYKVIKLQNCSEFGGETPTIIITNKSPDWDAAYNNWIYGKFPTDNVAWKDGVFAITEQS